MITLDTSKLEKKGDLLTISQVLHAPRELVFKVWTDPIHLAHWWGPNGFTNPVCDLDLRRGGAILIHMRGPDGTVYPMAGTYKEIVVPEKLVFVSSALDSKGSPLFEVLTTVTFDEMGRSTKLTVQAVASKIRPEGRPHVAGMEEGWSQSLIRLEEYLASHRSRV
jgi:uncharacterized protein YndB with AHSA1/START domain